jgi:acylpyruvate hydrolase
VKFVTYLAGDEQRLAIVTGQDIIDLNEADPLIPSDLVAALSAVDDLAAIADRIRRGWSARRIPISSVSCAPVIPRPGKILCLGLNYVDHAAEGGQPAPAYPSFFMRGATSLVGHGQPARRPSVSHRLDFEAELACVIGRPARHVSRDEALDYVFGYSCFNDITLRDYQMKSPTWTVGKNFDATGAFGPWITTADELPPGAAGLRIQLRLNGVVEQDANTSDMICDVAQAIALLSEAMTLEPGDVIAMGTPAGIGAVRKPPLWMKPGDHVEVEIESLGVLANTIADEVRPQRPVSQESVE